MYGASGTRYSGIVHALQLRVLRTGPSALSVDDKDDDSCTPLHLAIVHGAAAELMLTCTCMHRDRTWPTGHGQCCGGRRRANEAEGCKVFD